MLKKPIPLNDGGSEPIDLATARLHLRLDATGSPPSHPDDDLVEGIIAAARESAEIYCGLAILNQSYKLQLDEFPASNGAIPLGLWPVNTITSITYVDDDGATQTLATSVYDLEGNQAPARVVLKYEQEWPATRKITNAVTVTFVAGYTDGQSPNSYPMPKSVKQAMLLAIGHFYENREATTEKAMTELPMGAIYLLTQHRINLGV